MPSASTVNSKMDAAITAIGNSDYATAEKRILEAQAALVAIPDSRKRDSEFEWDRQGIDRLLSRVQRKQRAGGGLKVSHVEYERVDKD